MRTRPVRQELLRERLDTLVATFDISTIEPDPLQLVLRYTDPYDQEVAALIAAAFAYGRADIVVRNAGMVLDAMRPGPHAYLQTFQADEALTRFAGFAHRFHKTRDLVALLGCLAHVLQKYGSLGALFRGCSACKRMNLFLRWMVRRTPPDLGIWDFVDPAKLVVPLDTHVHRIATFLGLTKRKSADWKCARAVTDRLAKFDPADPVRYDFAICRLGILDLCSRRRRKENCDVCLLRDVCRFPVR
jgi:hypothetical protein